MLFPLLGLIVVAVGVTLAFPPRVVAQSAASSGFEALPGAMLADGMAYCEAAGKVSASGSHLILDATHHPQTLPLRPPRMLRGGEPTHPAGVGFVLAGTPATGEIAAAPDSMRTDLLTGLTPGGTMKLAPTIARYLLGLIFVVFGLNFWLHFLPAPAFGQRAMAFFGALMDSGYLMQVDKLFELAAGLLLLLGLYVPLALVLLAPIVLNIVLFHVFLAPEALPIAIVVLALELFLAWSYRDAFSGVLRARTPRPAAR